MTDQHAAGVGGPESPRHSRLLWVAAAGLILISVAYLGYGFAHLVYFPTNRDSDNSAIDLRLRWIMQRILYSGHNPLADDYRKENVPEHLWVNDAYVGDFHPYQAIYPPWAYFSQTFLIMPHDNFQVCRNWMALLNLLAVAITAIWAYGLGRPHGEAAAWFMVGVVLAVMGHLSALRVGQYGIIINACLIGMYWLEGRGRGIPSGLLFGVAAIKPNVSALFFFVFVVRRQYGAILASALYVAVSGAFCWVLTGTDPFTMLAGMFRHSQEVTDQGDSLLRYLISYQGGDPTFRARATAVMAITGFAANLVLMYFWRNRSTLTLFAIAAVIGRLWTYHFRTDNPMMVFLIAPLGLLVLTRPMKWTLGAFLAVGLTVWLPGPPLSIPGLSESTAYMVVMANCVLQSLVWLAGLAVLLAYDRAPLVRPQDNGEAAAGKSVPQPSVHSLPGAV